MYSIGGIRGTSDYDISGRLITSDHDDNQSSIVAIYVNQCGYDSDKPKVATITNKISGMFFVRDTDGHVVHAGEIAHERADFSSVTAPGEYYLQCGAIKSQVFKVADNRILDVSLPLAIRFMEESRQDAFEGGALTGYAWRDSHQFSFELNSLVMMYVANPDYWESLPWDVYRVADCEYPELRVQNEPNIIWLIKFAIKRYYDLNVNKNVDLHGLIKEQIAYFLWLYPQIADYVDASYYATIRDWVISIWGVNACSKQWYAIDGENHNLYHVQAAIGTVKGQYPPGHAITPNLMMAEVCKRDGLNHTKFLASGLNNLNWLVNHVDLSDPANTKGQRMSEWITFHNLTWVYEHFKNYCPSSTCEVIRDCAKLFVSRANNKWDYVMYTQAGDLSDAESDRWVNMENTGGLCNQPGNVAGFSAIAYMLRRCLPETETTLRNRLLELAVSHIDHCYGRNPLGRHFCYKATEEFDGATKGWVERMPGGYGMLENVIGVLDGSPKEASYPFNPAADSGYTEGWVAFNSAFNMALACICAESVENEVR